MLVCDRIRIRVDTNAENRPFIAVLMEYLNEASWPDESEVEYGEGYIELRKKIVVGACMGNTKAVAQSYIEMFKRIKKIVAERKWEEKPNEHRQADISHEE